MDLETDYWHEIDKKRTPVEKKKKATLILKDKQPKLPVYLQSFTDRITNSRSNFYDSNNDEIFQENYYDDYNEVKIRDAKSLGMVYEMIVQSGSGSKSRQLLETSSEGIALGDPGSQTRAIVGDPIGWKPANKFKDGWKTATKISEGSWPPKDTFINGRNGQKTNRLGCAKITTSNFYQWGRYNCWICGMPLHWDNTKPEGEHKLPYGFMCVFGPGPVSKLCLVEDEDDDTEKGLDFQTNRRSIYSSISSKLSARFSPQFNSWKDVCRGEEYAWSHPYCNKIKHSINFVKLGTKDNGDLIYYINYSGIKFVADIIAQQKPMKIGGRYQLSGSEKSAKGGSTLRSVRNKLLAECNTGNLNDLDPRGRGRYRTWGAEFMYEIMVKQLKPLVYLLNESFPDIDTHYLNDSQEKIRTNVYFNYKRLCKAFPILKNEYNNTNMDLVDFFDNVDSDRDDHIRDRKKFLNTLFDNNNTRAYIGSGGGKIPEKTLEKYNITQDKVDTFIRQFTDLKLYEKMFQKENIFEDPFNPNSSDVFRLINSQDELNKIMGNSVIEESEGEPTTMMMSSTSTTDDGPIIKDTYILNDIDTFFMEEKDLKTNFLVKLRDEILEDQNLESDLTAAVKNMIWLDWYKKLAPLFLKYFKKFLDENKDKEWYKSCCAHEEELIDKIVRNMKAIEAGMAQKRILTDDGQKQLTRLKQQRDKLYVDKIHNYLYPVREHRQTMMKHSGQSFRKLYNKLVDLEIGEFANGRKADIHQKDMNYLHREEKSFLKTVEAEIDGYVKENMETNKIIEKLQEKYKIGKKKTDNYSKHYYRNNDLGDIGMEKFKEFIEDKKYKTPIEVEDIEEFLKTSFSKSMPKPFTTFLKGDKDGKQLIKDKSDLQKKYKGKDNDFIIPGQDINDPERGLKALAYIGEKAKIHNDEEELLKESKRRGDVMMMMDIEDSDDEVVELDKTKGKNVLTSGTPLRAHGQSSTKGKNPKYAPKKKQPRNMDSDMDVVNETQEQRKRRLSQKKLVIKKSRKEKGTKVPWSSDDEMEGGKKKRKKRTRRRRRKKKKRTRRKKHKKKRSKKKRRRKKRTRRRKSK